MGEVEMLLVQMESINQGSSKDISKNTITQTYQGHEIISSADKKMNELRALLEHQTTDDEDNQLRYWLKERILGGGKSDCNIEQIKSIVDYLKLTAWSIPFTIKGCTLQQGEIYQFNNSV